MIIWLGVDSAARHRRIVKAGKKEWRFGDYKLLKALLQAVEGGMLKSKLSPNRTATADKPKNLFLVSMTQYVGIVTIFWEIIVGKDQKLPNRHSFFIKDH